MTKNIYIYLAIGSIAGLVIAESFTIIPTKAKKSYQKQQECYGEILEEILHTTNKLIEKSSHSMSRLLRTERYLLEDDKNASFVTASSQDREEKIKQAQQYNNELRVLIERIQNFEKSL